MTDLSHIFSAFMHVQGIAPETPLGVAVSGGGDSMALALLAREYCKGRVLALTVDHGLRVEAKQEAENVGESLIARGIEHRILTWHGEKPATHIQERARAARYRLLREACVAENIGFLALAHNAEDRIETFWMRLSHGSGLDGLAGMAARRNDGDVEIIRPLLSCAREDLRSHCRAKGLAWIEDPSNENQKYLRVKLRQFEDLLAQEGLTPERLSLTLQKLEDARDALRHVADRAFADIVKAHAEGYLTLEARLLEKHPADIRRRVIEKCLAVFAAEDDYPTPFEALEDLHRDLLSAEFSGRTLGGCDVSEARGKIIFCREEAAAAPRRKIAEGILWDGRFWVSGSSGEAELGKLGEEGISALRKHLVKESAFEALPFKVKKTLPALWRGENLLAVPLVSWHAADLPESLRGIQTCFKIV